MRFTGSIIISGNIIGLVYPINWLDLLPIKNLYYIILTFAEFAFAQEARLNAGINIVKVSTEPFGPFKYNISTDYYLDTDEVIQYYLDIVLSFQTEDIYDPESLIDAKDLYIEIMTKNGTKYVLITDDEFFDAVSTIKDDLFK